MKLLERMVDIRMMLQTDVIATYCGDPAAPGLAIIIRSYPSVSALIIYRVANLLFKFGAKMYSRELMESLHQMTGIDIHPGAEIKGHFFIDHGVGVVIGETCIIGEWVRLYQSVTLGALHFQEEDGILVKGKRRHPILGNYVTVGAGAKILGDITIGDNSSIGANCWIQESVKDNSTIFISSHPTMVIKQKKVKEKKNDLEVLDYVPMPTPSPLPMLSNFDEE